MTNILLSLISFWLIYIACTLEYIRRELVRRRP